MSRSAFWVALAASAGLLLPGQASAAPHHPLLHQALHDLKGVISELEGAGHDFGGHKEAALKDLRFAAEQIEKALIAVKDPFPQNFKAKPDLYKDYKNFRHLRHAEIAIDESIVELKESKFFGDHKEHKEKAIEALKAAHGQVKDCIKHIK